MLHSFLLHQVKTEFCAWRKNRFHTCGNFEIDSCLDHLHNPYLFVCQWHSFSFCLCEVKTVSNDKKESNSCVMLPADLCLNLADARGKKRAFHWHPLALQHLKLPVSPTRWHSCIEGRVQEHKQEARDKPGNQMFQCVCVVTAEATTRYVTSCISITVCFHVVRAWQWQFARLSPTHHFYFGGDLNFCHAERKNPEELSECLLPF